MLMSWTLIISSVSAISVVTGEMEQVVRQGRHQSAAPSMVGQLCLVREALDARVTETWSKTEAADQLHAKCLMSARAIRCIVDELSDWCLEAMGGMIFSQQPERLRNLEIGRMAGPLIFSRPVGTEIMEFVNNTLRSLSETGRMNVHS